MQCLEEEKSCCTGEAGLILTSALTGYSDTPPASAWKMGSRYFSAPDTINYLSHLVLHGDHRHAAPRPRPPADEAQVPPQQRGVAAPPDIVREMLKIFLN